jgi:hypothetical protein
MARIEDMASHTEDAPMSELLHRVTDDVRTIARDELELVRGEIGRGVNLSRQRWP